MDGLSHRWEKGHRYYEAQVTEDLYGWVFVRTWGKKGTRLGRSMRVRIESSADGMKAIEQVKKRREYRGYETVKE
jgi:predicted DNA-binding WGR domain protein